VSVESRLSQRVQAWQFRRILETTMIFPKHWTTDRTRIDSVRLNASTRLYMKRLNRLTLAFSKKLENFRMTPAMALGIENDFWGYGELVERAS
jgi:hypothetical protein